MLRNRLDIHAELDLASAEKDITTSAASDFEFSLPPYDLKYLQRVHNHLFRDLYEWAGEVRTIDISKGDTRFCTADRIQPEADKLFLALSDAGWLEGLGRTDLVVRIAEFYGDLNVVHPFREGNGRAQRLFFEHIIINAGYEIDWWQVEEFEWLRANIEAVNCDYQGMELLFNQCIGTQLPQ